MAYRVDHFTSISNMLWEYLCMVFENTGYKKYSSHVARNIAVCVKNICDTEK